MFLRMPTGSFAVILVIEACARARFFFFYDGNCIPSPRFLCPRQPSTNCRICVKKMGTSEMGLYTVLQDKPRTHVAKYIQKKLRDHGQVTFPTCHTWQTHFVGIHFFRYLNHQCAKKNLANLNDLKSDVSAYIQSQPSEYRQRNFGGLLVDISMGPLANKKAIASLKQ